MVADDFISIQLLEAQLSPAYLLDIDGRIRYVNAAWDRVAVTAGGPSATEVVGSTWLDAIYGDELKAWFARLLERVLGDRVGEGHVGDCNTEAERRVYFARFEPLKARGQSQAAAMLVATTFLMRAPVGDHYRVGVPDELRYRQEGGVIRQCGGCRRVRVANAVPPVWEFVPEYVSHPRQDVSHGLCELCREVHYGGRFRSG